MEVLNNIKDIDENYNLIAILGNFDGMHKGHMALIDTAKNLKKVNDKIIVVTFDPHPRDYMGRGVKKLFNSEEKLAAFQEAGIDMVLLLPFKEVAYLSPETFVKKYLVEGLKVKKVVIGYNYHFGKLAVGTSDDMVAFGARLGFDPVVVPEYMKGGVNISSSVIRGLLEDHDIMKANELLGYTFSLEGKVVHGKGLGKKLGFPTANLQVNEDKIWPGLGVYCVYGYIKGECYYGICNVGFQPTVDEGERKMAVEVNFLNFNEDIYDETIRIYFLDYLREIAKFDSKEDLTKQLQADKSKTVDIVKILCG